MNVNEFYKSHLGNRYNSGRGWNDSKFGYQCVAGFKRFLEVVGIKPMWTPTGYASGYWEKKDELGLYKYFVYITNPKDFRDGDWVIWPYGSKSHPISHIAMYYQGKSFGQNQLSNNPSFTLISTNFNDAYGALRPKVFIKNEWVLDSIGWRYCDKNKHWARNEWQLIDNKWYFFGDDWYMKKGWQYIGNHWYFLDKVNGNMVTGWIRESGKIYYLDEDGRMLKGDVNVPASFNDKGQLNIIEHY